MVVGSMTNPNGKIDDGMWKAFEARQGRRAHPSEIGDAVVMLSTPRMSLINGVNLMADGGYAINEGFE